VLAQPAELRDQVTNPRPLRVELDPAREMVRNVAEVRARLRDQVDPRRDKQDPPQRALEGDQPDQRPPDSPARTNRNLRRSQR
jgi:hypothetical protein